MASHAHISFEICSSFFILLYEVKGSSCIITFSGALLGKSCDPVNERNMKSRVSNSVIYKELIVLTFTEWMKSAEILFRKLQQKKPDYYWIFK